MTTDTSSTTRLVENMPEDEYHAHPALGSGDVRGLFASLDAPYRWKYRQEHPPKIGDAQRRAFDIGSAVHTHILGGPEVVTVYADSWRSAAARRGADDARATGSIPLLTADAQLAESMAAAVLADPLAGPTFARPGRSEVSLFWQDRNTGVPCKARIDWLPEPEDGRPLVLLDVKTTQDASPEGFTKSCDNFGYAQQAAHYLDAVAAVLGRHDDVTFAFVCVEKEPPHMVAVHYLRQDWLIAAERANRRALDAYAEGTKAGRWGTYTDDGAHELVMPRWSKLRELL